LGTGHADDIALGDLDGDGDLDAFISEESFGEAVANEVWLNEEDVPDPSIHGMKWNDLDGDGSQDDGEPGLANWQIQLQGDNGIFSSTLTGSQGNYWFMNLPPGNYTVTEVLQSDWQQTWPEDGQYAFLLSPGLIVENANFGNWSSYAVYLPAILKQ
jgi:hypothetical protein